MQEGEEGELDYKYRQEGRGRRKGDRVRSLDIFVDSLMGRREEGWRLMSVGCQGGHEPGFKMQFCIWKRNFAWTKKWEGGTEKVKFYTNKIVF